MKRILSLLLVLAMVLALAACGAESVNLALEALEAAESLSESAESPEALPDLSVPAPESPTESAPDAQEPEAPIQEVEAPAPEPETPAQEIEPSPQENEPSVQESETAAQEDEAPTLPEDGVYDSKDEVALYIHLYGHLPDNYITKTEAQNLGWSGGSLEPYAPGKCIGGSYFGNYEGLLPEAPGRRYTECDIDTLGASGRGAKRIVFSNDGLIYYTEDHYASFELLYGEVGT